MTFLPTADSFDLSDWPVVPLRRLCQSLQTGPFGSQLGASEYVFNGIPVVNPANLQQGRIVLDPSCTVDEATRDRLRRHELAEGDLVFGRRGEMGRCALVHRDEAGWLCGTGSIRVRLIPSLAYGPFVLYALATARVRDWLSLASVGSTMENLNTGILGRLPLYAPVLTVQRSIADFLDRETAKIDALIAKQGEMVQHLEERRQSLFSEAFRRFSDKTARLRFISHILPGFAFASEGFEHGSGDVRLLRGINVSPRQTVWDEAVYLSRERGSQFQRFALAAGDIVIGMDRPWISSGIRVARIRSGDLPALLVQRVARVRCRHELSPDYLELCLHSREFLAHFEPDMTGVSVPHISDTQIGNFRVPLPSFEEQIRFVDEMHGQLSVIERSVEMLREVGRKAVEKRSALITAAVTGQIDVASRIALEAAE